MKEDGLHWLPALLLWFLCAVATVWCAYAGLTHGRTLILVNDPPPAAPGVPPNYNPPEDTESR